MRRFRIPLISLAALLAVAACGKRDPVARGAEKTTGLPAIDEPAPSAAGEPHGNATSPAPPETHAPGAQIPAALQGRWGLTPADCIPGRSDAKGLLVVSADELRFYESRAVPSADVAADADSLSGQFSFTGEGQNWTKFQALKSNGRELVRTETNPAASFSYARCS